MALKKIGMRVTDKDRLVALRRLAVKTGRIGSKQLPFRSDQLRYTSTFLNRFSNSVAQRENGDGHSMLMVRKMVDEYLLEITAQINWYAQANNADTKKIVNEFGLKLWDHQSRQSDQAFKVA